MIGNRAPAPGSHFSPLLSLPFPILDQIISYLPIPHLRQCAPTCQALHNLIIPHVYHTVSLSTHNDPDGKTLNPASRTRAVRLGQWQFLRQLRQTPGYARYVRVLSWTMHFYRLAVMPWERWPEEDSIDNEAYEVFALMKNVREVDITFWHPPNRIPRGALGGSAGLFPQARKIRLGGKMSYKFAKAVLASAEKDKGGGKANLESLELDCAVDVGTLRNGQRFEYRPTDENGRVLDVAMEEFNKDDWPEGELPRQTPNSPMRRLLSIKEVQDRCCSGSLRVLALRKQGHQHSQAGFWRNDCDVEVYQEWADFIKNSKPTKLTLQHEGANRPDLVGDNSGRRGARVLPHEDMPPMDQRFKEILLPALVEGWPQLESIEIKGVKREVLAKLFDANNRSVQISVDPTVEIAWRSELP